MPTRASSAAPSRLAGQATTDLKLRDIARTVGTVLQDPAKQIVGATVEAELAFGPENLGVPREEIRALVGAVSEQAGIASLLGRETAALSGGERQLLAMAGILMMRPRLYVVDEPLANLDPLSAARLLAILRALADRGDAVVIVEHRVEEALVLRPDRVLYLDAGVSRYLGPVDGFLEIADPHEVKLPFEVVLDRARAGGLSASPEPLDRVAGQRDPEGVEDAPPRLEFRAVEASIGSHRILHGVDARLGRREVIAVLGPNGSGKTTAFRTAMRLLPVTSGQILVGRRGRGGPLDGEPCDDLRLRLPEPQPDAVRPLRPRGARVRPEEPWPDPATFELVAANALRRTALDQLEGILDRPPLSLSFGQQKRLALAIALTLQPASLILDEPSAGQDHQTAEGFVREVLAIPGLESVYFITHDVDLALTHADRILLFRDGRIVADGPPKEVIVDQARWQACNLTSTSLMQANARWGARDGRFLDAETLARRIVAAEAGALDGTEGGTGVDAG